MGLFTHRRLWPAGYAVCGSCERPVPPDARCGHCDATHVLQRIPEFLVKGGPPFWELQSRANYDAGTPAYTLETLDLPEDADPVDLAEWTAGQVGYPVVLVPGEEDIRLPYPFARWHTVPLYFVSPEGKA